MPRAATRPTATSRVAFFVAFFLAFFGTTRSFGVRSAKADSARDVATRVVEQWRDAGGHATLQTTRFVFDDETVVIPVADVSKAASADVSGCTHIALIGARGLSFRARLSDARSEALTAEFGARAASLAGVVELRRCGLDRPIRHVVVTSEAGRGALEVVVARAPSALPSLTSVIPERTGGALPAVADAGPLPILAAPEKRAEIAERRARREGATIDARTLFRARDDGGGEVELPLGEGCHRLELFARDPRADGPGRRLRLDIDAELREPSTERVLARDRTEAPDARLETCLGEATNPRLVFVGAPANAVVTATLASWPLPSRLPWLWGQSVRSKMARALFVRNVVAPVDPPVFLGQGSSGTTPFPVPVETGGCYLAVVALTHGHARSLQLRSTAGASESSDERGAAEEVALSAFCVGAQVTPLGLPQGAANQRARLEVHARGTSVGWALAVFRVRSGTWEVGR